MAAQSEISVGVPVMVMMTMAMSVVMMVVVIHVNVGLVTTPMTPITRHLQENESDRKCNVWLR